MATANLFSGGCLLCMPFGSKLLELHVETSWLHFVAVVNFIIIADKFRKKKNNSFKRTDCSDWRDNVIIIDW